MTGLLQKDFYNLRTAIKNLLLILVIFIAYLIFRKHEFILPLVPVLLSSSLLTTVINLDRHSKWNMLMITAPLQKSELVKEKYVLLMLLNDYIDRCLEVGYDYDYDRHDKSFYATDKSGNDLTVCYEGFDIMYIYVRNWT